MFRIRADLTAGLITCCGLILAPRPSTALDLGQALVQAATANPTLAARAAEADAARRRSERTGAWSSPMLELGVVNVPTTGRLDFDEMTMKMIGVSQRVPVFGANRLARRAAVAAADGEVAAAEGSVFEVWGLTWEAYADAYYARELRRLAEAHGTVMEHMIQSARARYESGSGRLEDVLRAQAEQARVFTDVATYQGEETAARARLDVLRGVAPNGDADSLDVPPVPLIPASPEPWLAAIVPSHPRLREQQAQVDRYRLSVRAAHRLAWPDLELRGSYGRREPLLGRFPQNNMFSASVGFIVPIFGDSRGTSEAGEMEAMARASEADRTAAELDLRGRVVAAHAAAAAAQRTVTLLADTVVTTQRRATEAAWISYRAGATDLWRVFESSHALYAEEIALLRAFQDLAHAEAQMLTLTGRSDLLGVVLPSSPKGPTRRER